MTRTVILRRAAPFVQAARDGLLAFDVRYLVRPAAPRVPTVCHATARMRWTFTVPWGGEWQPYDLATRCLGQTLHAPLGG